MPSQEHWETVYRDRVPKLLTWYQAEPALSLSLISASRVESDAAVVDVGGGSSRLVDHLLEHGFTDVTVLDISPTALRYARDRLADRADEATFIEGDVLEHRFDSAVDFRHDRAVFHFLIDSTDRNRYVECLNTTIAADGHVVIATFGLDGPERCSGRPRAALRTRITQPSPWSRLRAGELPFRDTHHTNRCNPGIPIRTLPMGWKPTELTPLAQDGTYELLTSRT
jgi:SAM-dependent methyltransferase